MGRGVLAGQALLALPFGRSEPREQAAGCVRSLLAPLERKNGRTISEARGAVAEGALVADDPGFLKKGTKSARVQLREVGRGGVGGIEPVVVRR